MTGKHHGHTRESLLHNKGLTGDRDRAILGTTMKRGKKMNKKKKTRKLKPFKLRRLPFLLREQAI